VVTSTAADRARFGAGSSWSDPTRHDSVVTCKTHIGEDPRRRNEHNAGDRVGAGRVGGQKPDWPTIKGDGAIF
jgi:hypothetical protein